MARTLPNLELIAFFLLGEDGWDDEMSLNLLKLSILTQGIAKSKVSATPGSPTEGDVHIFDETHATQPNKIAVYDDATWKHITPKEGWLIYNQATDNYEKFDGTVWAALPLGVSQAYVDGLIAKISSRKVRVASTAAITLATGCENGDTIDGVVLATGDRVLLKNQASGSENGIWVVAASGSPTRAGDADSSDELVNVSVWVAEGTANADTLWTCTTNAPITVNTTALTFSQTGAGPTYATPSEVNSGASTTKVISPDSLNDSNYGRKVVQIPCTDPNGSAISTGDGQGYFVIPPELNGMNMVDAQAALVGAVSTSGLPTVQIANQTDDVDMLTTKITIDANERSSYTAATASVIDTTKDDVATGDILRCDVDVAGTGAKGLYVILTFQLP
jgi:hypothetical protein